MHKTRSFQKDALPRHHDILITTGAAAGIETLAAEIGLFRLAAGAINLRINKGVGSATIALAAELIGRDHARAYSGPLLAKYMKRNQQGEH